MKCPGQDTQFWDANAIFEAPCPQCGGLVEFFKDDTTRKCGRCGHRFVNPKMDFGCAAYCNYAEQCLGDLPPELVARKEELLKDRVAVAVKRYFKSDFKGIGRAARRARHAEQIGRSQQAGNLAAVLIAAYVWDLATGSADEADASPVRSLLAGLKAPDPLVDRVCRLIVRKDGLNGDGDIDRLLTADAAAVTRLEDDLKGDKVTREQIPARIRDEVRTTAGQAYARDLLLGNGS